MTPTPHDISVRCFVLQERIANANHFGNKHEAATLKRQLDAATTKLKYAARAASRRRTLLIAQAQQEITR